MDINDIIDCIEAKRVKVTNHAIAEAAEDNLDPDTIFYSVLEGEIIEDYPTDKPCPSCLVFGMTASSEPVHSVWAYNQDEQIAILITVYRPDPVRWINWRTRRKLDEASP